MKLRIVKLIPAVLAFIFGFSFLVSQPAIAATNTNVCSQLTKGTAAWEANGCSNKSANRLPNVIMNIINVVLGLVGIIAVIFIIIGGVNYMTSLGDPGKVKKARDTILYAVIGLIVVILAAAIVNFVIGATSKSSQTNQTNQSTQKTTNT